MSLEDYAPVFALGKQALMLDCKGKPARAAAKFDEALALAASFAPDDCLVVASLKQRAAMFAAVVINDEAEPIEFGHVLKHADLAFTAAAVCVRRYAAGTLLPGECRPAEEAWHAIMMETYTNIAGEQATAEFLKAVKPIAGVDAFFKAAPLQMIYFAMLYGRTDGVYCLPPLATVCDMAETAAAVLLQQVLRDAPLRSPNLGLWHSALHDMHDQAIRIAGCLRDDLPPEFQASISEALRSLSRCAEVLQNAVGSEMTSKLESLHQEGREREHKIIEKTAAARAPERRRTCALAGCGALEAHSGHFGRCSKCKTVSYCCRAHQEEAWPGHKKACKEACKAAAAAAASPEPEPQLP
jgi:hypothetical protein